MNFSVYLNSFKGMFCRFWLILFCSNSCLLFYFIIFLFRTSLLRGVSEKFLSYFLRFLPLLFHVFVQNFLEFVQNKIFFVQKPEEIPACFFWISRIFYSGFRIFFGRSLLFWVKESGFSHLPIRFLRVFFYFVGYDSLVSFPSVCLFPYSFDKKSIFFQNEPSFRICIFSLFVWIFSYFFGCYGRFFCPASHPFLHFSVRLQKIICCFFSSGSSVFWDFFASSE